MRTSIVLRQAFAALLSAASAAGAQAVAFSMGPSRGGGPDSLPRELVTALLRTSYGGSASDAEFFVGKVPPAIEPYLYVPPGARILGGYSSFSGTTVAMAVQNMNFQDVAAMYAREQPKLGWSAPPTAFDMRGWGFQPPPGASMMGGLDFCHIGQSLQIMPSPDGANTYIVAQVQNFGGRCSAPNRSMTGGRAPAAPAAPAYPTVINPVGANMNAQVCNQPFVPTLGGSSTSERLQTVESAAGLLDYFAKQLADSGWASAPATPMARRQFTRPDSAGNRRELTLTATPAPSSPGTTCLDVNMSVRVVPAVQIRR
jgi:hypothetical protein